MTYCLAIRLDAGLLFLADTRTNAGIDNIGTYRKLHVLRPAPDRIFVLESAGSLATNRAALSAVGADGTATFILGGQIAGDRPDILLVYPEGNYIRTSDTVPFLQIGEHKYGKFLLELAVRAHVDLQTAAKVALGSMLSTAHANLSVGPPYDAAIYRNGSLEVQEMRIEADHPYLAELNQVWIERLIDSVEHLPRIPNDVLEQVRPEIT
jgi:putative proteasome-type protease